MKLWIRRLKFFVKIIGKMQAKSLVLKETNEFVELVHVAEVNGNKSYIVVLSDGSTLTVEEHELGSRRFITDPRIAFGLSAVAGAVLALFSVVSPDFPIEDLVQEAKAWFAQTTDVN